MNYIYNLSKKAATFTGNQIDQKIEETHALSRNKMLLRIYGSNISDNLISISKFSKPYKEGKIINYIEREWRYVPIESDHVFLNTSLNLHKLNNNYHASVADYLNFNINDINHIILPNDKYVREMVKYIDNETNLNQNYKNRLIQLITNSKKIKNDF